MAIADTSSQMFQKVSATGYEEQAVVIILSMTENPI